MFDLSYNIETGDWNMEVQEDGGVDFVITDNPSTQNGGIILEYRAFNSSNPILGIGINQISRGTVLQANYEMNRWKQQVFDDGGRASFNAPINAQGQPRFAWYVNYE